jgi:sulfatase modifying factor 1
MRWISSLGMVFTVLSAAGCSSGGSSTGATGGSPGVTNESGPCPGTAGPTMVRLPQGYCIDSTEVTRTEYAAWLATNPPLPLNTDAKCGWNSSYIPGSDWTDPTGTRPNDPVAFVNWCDAYAYCAGVGKRLCGKIGGGANAYSDYADPSSSQWYSACSADGANAYPYGSAYDKAACNGPDANVGNAEAVGTLTTCQSSTVGYEGVYDLSGNVREWEDSCAGTAGKTDSCRLRGGSYSYFATSVACNDSFTSNRGYADGDTGIRCCS